MHDAQSLVNVQSLIYGHPIIYDGDQLGWCAAYSRAVGALEGYAFECLEDIKGVQVAISTRAMLELLRHMGQLHAPSANLTKPRMAALIINALVSHEGWATSELGKVHLASSSWDSPNLPSLAFDLELTSEFPVRLFFPAGGVTRAAEDGPKNGVALPNADAAAAKQLPGVPDLAAILVAVQQGFTQQRTVMEELKSGQAWMVAQLATLSGDTVCLSDKVNQMGNKFEQEVKRIDLSQKRLEERLKQLKTGWVEQPSVVVTSMTMDSSTLISESSLPAPESYLPWAAKLAAVNPARQNPN